MNCRPLLGTGETVGASAAAQSKCSQICVNKQIPSMLDAADTECVNGVSVFFFSLSLKHTYVHTHTHTYP